MMEALLLLLLILLFLVAINAPIYIAILAAAFYLQVFVNHMPLQNLFTGMFEALTKNSLLAVPFFVMAGSLISAGSLGTRLINFFVLILKNVRGGLAIACLFSNAVFGAISGSAPAAVATFGKVTYDPMKNAYGEKLALGLITSAGTLSAIIPPSIIMIIYGIATDSSVAQLFMAGFLPGLVVVFVVGIYLIIQCKTNVFAEEKTTFQEIKDAFVKGIPVLVLPFLILGGIYAGVVTPTEAGAFAALYAFFMGIFVLKDLKMKDMPAYLKDAAKTTGQVFILVASSTVLAQAATISQLPQHLASFFSSFGTIQFLLFLNILLLLVGCFFEPGSAILILAPMILPAAESLGINSLHLGVIFCMNLAIGMFTPPFGLSIFVAQSVMKKPMGQVAASAVPYVILYIVALLIVTYIPSISTFLPNLLY